MWKLTRLASLVLLSLQQFFLKLTGLFPARVTTSCLFPGKSIIVQDFHLTVRESIKGRA